MPLFTYTALTETGTQVTGDSAAPSVDSLRLELSEKGLFVQDVRTKRSSLRISRRQTVRPDEFLLFNQEFLALVRAGLTMPEALQLASQRPDSPVLGGVLQRVLEDVRRGQTVSEACTHHPETFDAFYLSALKTGEKTGDMPSILMRYHEYLQQRVALQKKVSQAMAYPIFLLIALIVILGVLFSFVLPRFVSLYADFDAALPWPTRVLMAVVETMPIALPAMAIMVTSLWVSWRKWRATESGRLWIDGVKLRIPYVKSILRPLVLAQFARSMSTLLAGGTPLVEAMRTTQEAMLNRAYAESLVDATQKVIDGSSLCQALSTTLMLPETALRMVEVGEATGGLDEMLGEVATFYEGIIDQRLGRIMTLIEPMLMLIMGLMIGGIIIVMYLPIFHLADIVK